MIAKCPAIGVVDGRAAGITETVVVRKYSVSLNHALFPERVVTRIVPYHTCIPGKMKDAVKVLSLVIPRFGRFDTCEMGIFFLLQGKIPASLAS